MFADVNSFYDRVTLISWGAYLLPPHVDVDNGLRVTAAAQATNTGNTAAVDHYSICRETCKVIRSNAILQRRFSRPGIEVEVDETFLTRCKYHKGS